MKAVITGESERIGIKIQDNNGVDHGIEMDSVGDIKYYEQDGYPDESSNRTTADEISMEQAQLYARYYVQRERGYPTFERRLAPEWLAYSLGAVFALDFNEFTEYFGEYAHQYHSSLRPTIDPIVDVPYDEAGGIVFRADVFMGLGFAEYLDNPEDMDPLNHVAGITDDYDLVSSLSELVMESLPEESKPIEEVSAVDVLYQTKTATGSVEEHTVAERSHTQDRPADVQLQMTPPKATLEQDLSTEVIQGLVLHHLTCQVRDAYLRLGLEPPEPFRILGQGLYEQTIRYQHTEMYEPYHLTDADIDGYRQPGFETGAIEGGAIQAKKQASTLGGLIKQALFGG